MKRLVLIAGPTASGKSALALDLARKHDGVVINADSMQVYRDLHIITARPSAEEAQAPHRLYGHVDAAVNYSTGQWCREAADVISQVQAEGKLPIVVGGTGLYFTALTQGLSAVPTIPDNIRERIRARVANDGVEAMHRELSGRDPATAARITVRDRARVTRALEVVEATGRTLTDWHKEGMPPIVDAAASAKVFLTCEREALVARITRRFDAMLEAGALEEVRGLEARKLNPLLPAMKAHGVPWLIRHLRGEITLEEAAEGGKMDTRRYAKRQHTWFRNQLPDWPWAKAEDGLRAVETQLAGA
jgi:tRNA dimethylallyltransferase